MYCKALNGELLEPHQGQIKPYLFGDINIHSYLGSWFFTNKLSLAKEITRIGTKPRAWKKKTNYKKCKPKSNPKLKTQICKARTWYMLKDDLNIILF